jgi:hypothetical protein
MVAQRGQEGKREATPSLPQTRNAFHPLLTRQGLSTDLRGKTCENFFRSYCTS